MKIENEVNFSCTPQKKTLSMIHTKQTILCSVRHMAE